MTPEPSAAAVASIIDIRRDELKDSLRDDIPKLLRENRLPTLLLYDDRGLKLFEKITYLEEYYLTSAEIHVLEHYAHAIANRIPRGSLVVELGSGYDCMGPLGGRVSPCPNLRKVNILLEALEKARKDVDYYALDLDHSELERTLAAVPPYDHVRCHGLHGTYDDGLAWLQSEDNMKKPKCIMSLGSSIGNFPHADAAVFLKGFADILGPQDVFLLGLDGCHDPSRVYHAYNDREGVTHEFIRNGLRNANRVMGREIFDDSVWQVIGEYDEKSIKHHAFVSPMQDVDIGDILIRAGERIRIEESYKYPREQAQQLFDAAGMIVGATFADQTGTYHINMLSKSEYAVSRDPDQYAASAVPTLQEWEQLWACWDLATRKMLPEQETLTKPIKLRNCCLFYLGHIPTFLDMHITRVTDGKPTPPDYYPKIFERGIDPDVDNPEQCHAHSEIPEEWPALSEILKFQEDVRMRVRKLYSEGTAESNPKLRRILPFGFEHEVMHLETFLYILLQSDHVQPPAGVQPDFTALAEDARRNAGESKWVDIPCSTITIGREDAYDDYNPGHFFSWDIEYPSRKADVHAFQTQSRPLTNAEYAKYLVGSSVKGIPTSWTTITRSDSGFSETNGQVNGTNSHTNGTSTADVDAFIKDKAVRTVYGPVPLNLALDWAVSASYDELNACAQYFGGRIPTYEETRSIYNFAEHQRSKDLAHIPSATIPAVNGHLSHNGVHQTPPSDGSAKTGSGETPEQVTARERDEIFADLTGLNVGFNHFHPTPVTAKDSMDGLRQGGFGGLWEWTSTPLFKPDGFVPMDIYPVYSADFFDGKHNIVQGGSWATHSRYAGRKTCVNWYQRNYPYVWAGARMVRDV